MLELEALADQTITLLGQSKNFAFEEIEELLQLDKIAIEKSLHSHSTIIIAGRLLNPHLEAEIDLLEKDPKVQVISIESFERSLAASIHEEGLYLSLKLSHDNSRIASYLCNALISDSVFLKILPLFDWEGETLFGNDANRDICAALTRRFYPKVIQNHNIEYSPNGIHETVLETNNADLLEALVNVSVIKEGFSADEKAIEHQILEAIAANRAVGAKTLKQLAQSDDGRLAPLIAVSPNVDSQTAQLLFDKQDPQTLVGLGSNTHVDASLRVALVKEANDVTLYLAEHAPLTPQMFDAIFELLPLTTIIGKNSSLSSSMIQRLQARNIDSLTTLLASNPLVDSKVLETYCHSSNRNLLASLALNTKLSLECFDRLHRLDDEAIAMALAQNGSTPKEILDQLAVHQSEEVVKNVASNPQTNVATLYQLLLDMRYMAYVKANPSFGENIRQEIGWES